MIVKMQKVFVVARSAESDRLLEALGELGVVHLEPLDADRAVAPEDVLGQIDRLGRAVQVAGALEPSGHRPDLSAEQAAEEVLRIERGSAERRSRLAALHRQVEQLEMWGDVTLEQFAQLRERGIEPRFYSIPGDQVVDVRGELVEVIRRLPARRVLVAVIAREPERADVPEEARPIELPARDRPSLREEARRLDLALKQDAVRLSELAHLADDMSRALGELRRQARYAVAQRSGLADENFFAIQGWAPVEEAARLGDDLSAAGLDAAVQIIEPAEDEQPPTLIRYPRWARPIKGLFDILGTLPGYKEIDLSPFFMIALPVFAAMLIGDAGYGLVFLVLPLVFYRKLVAKAGKVKTHLIMVIGFVTLIWGVLTANYFGVSPDTIALGGGYVKVIDGKTVADIDAMRQGGGGWSAVGRFMMGLAPVWNSDAEVTRELLMKIAFVIGTLHLTIAQLRKALAQAPAAVALSSVGWAMFLWGMLVIIWHLMFLDLGDINWAICGTLLGGGYVLVLGFSSSSRKPVKRILLGFAGSLLPALGTFSDTMSYVRLMAVGLASFYIAAAFNGLGATLANAATWLVAAPVILFGHLLNIGLAIIAIFAHGVRLNMLEFSSNAGVQWAGHAYEPFAKAQIKEK